MKILIQNYNSALSTEPMYLHRCLVECGYPAELWGNPNISAFDVFDRHQPDMFITHYKFLTNDTIKYLSQKRKTHMVLNITGINGDEFKTLESLIKSNGISIPLAFTNLYDTKHVPKSESIKVIDLYPAADIFLAPAPTPEYSADMCVLSIEDNDLIAEATKDRDNYHKFSFNSQAEYADMNLDVAAVTSFYHKYKEIVLADDINFVTSQVLFDSILKSNKVTIKVSKEQEPMLNAVLGKLFVQQDEEVEISEMVKSQVRSKHNCFKRSARLFRALKMEEVSKKLESISDRL